MYNRHQTSNYNTHQPLQAVQITNHEDIRHYNVSKAGQRNRRSNSSNVAGLGAVASRGPVGRARRDNSSTTSRNNSTGNTTFRPLATSCRHLHRSASSTRLSRFTHHPLPSHDSRTTFSHTATLLRTITNGGRAPIRSHIFLTDAVPFPGMLIGLSISPRPSIHITITTGRSSGG